MPFAPLVEALRRLPVDEVPDGLKDLVGVDGARADGPTPGELDQSRLFEIVVLFFERLARAAPLVLVVEDVHWADRSTCDLLAYFLRAVHRHRILTVVTVRSDQVGAPARQLLAELTRAGIERVELLPLSRGDVERQMSGILDERVSREVVEEVFARSQGNPFFTEELVAAIDVPGSLPAELRDVLLARVANFDASARGLLGLVAASGRHAHHNAIVVASERPELEVLALLRELVDGACSSQIRKATPTRSATR